jgi:hypothetical protein
MTATGTTPQSDADRIRAILVEAADEVATEIDDLVASLTVVDAVQEVFARLGPERDRLTDWTRCTEEPWFSLAAIVRGDA